jgi:hypothetical protein
MNKDNLVTLSVFLFALILTVVLNNLLLTDKITDKVIDRLKRDYVPGPYEPGFDPDKVPGAPR